MTNPFESRNIRYLVLVNEVGQHSLWPERIASPAGWTVAFGPSGRDTCLAYVDRHWTALRPRGRAGA